MKDGTFLVTEVDADSAVLRDVADGQIHTLADNPGVEAGDLLEATIEPDPPMEVVWSVVDVERTFTVSVAESPEPPTQQAVDVAADEPIGSLTRRERAGTGEVHVLRVPEAETADAVQDVLDDEATVERAARLGVERVEVRSTEGVVSVRYLP
jgi:hypothetical protein